jgi:hypothetical protein
MTRAAGGQPGREGGELPGPLPDGDTGRPSPPGGGLPGSARGAVAMGKRIAPLLLLVGLAAPLLLMGRSWPRESEVIFRLEGERGEVIRMGAAFTRAGEGDQEAGASWSFPRGSAPPSVRTRVNLPVGDWEVATTLERADGPAWESKRRVRLEGGAVSIPVRVGGER